MQREKPVDQKAELRAQRDHNKGLEQGSKLHGSRWDPNQTMQVWQHGPIWTSGTPRTCELYVHPIPFCFHKTVSIAPLLTSIRWGWADIAGVWITERLTRGWMRWRRGGDIPTFRRKMSFNPILDKRRSILIHIGCRSPDTGLPAWLRSNWEFRGSQDWDKLKLIVGKMRIFYNLGADSGRSQKNDHRFLLFQYVFPYETWHCAFSNQEMGSLSSFTWTCSGLMISCNRIAAETPQRES